VLSGDIAMVRRFIDLGFDVNTRDFIGSIPLHTAAFYGFIDIIDLLHSEGTEINVVDKDGYTPLYRAVIGGQLAAVKRLYGLGANLNIKDNDGISPLKMARLKEFKEIEDFLIRNGAAE
jgi:ankyrin repeat protein